jgi:hypothetical protein
VALIAIVGAAMAKAVIVERSNNYRTLAQIHANAERSSIDYANQIRGLTGTSRLEARYEETAAYHRKLKIKLQPAARCSWLFLDQDPPQPYPPAGAIYRGFWR